MRKNPMLGISICILTMMAVGVWLLLALRSIRGVDDDCTLDINEF